jgi:hypothetical protein
LSTDLGECQVDAQADKSSASAMIKIIMCFLWLTAGIDARVVEIFERVLQTSPAV